MAVSTDGIFIIIYEVAMPRDPSASQIVTGDQQDGGSC